MGDSRGRSPGGISRLWVLLLCGGAIIGLTAGMLFDAPKSYDIMWWISIALGLIAAAVHWPIREEAVPRLRAAMA